MSNVKAVCGTGFLGKFRLARLYALKEREPDLKVSMCPWGGNGTVLVDATGPADLVRDAKKILGRRVIDSDLYDD